MEGLLLKEWSLNGTSLYIFVVQLVTLQEEEHSDLLYSEELILVTIYYKKVMIYCKKVNVSLNILFLELYFLCYLSKSPLYLLRFAD